MTKEEVGDEIPNVARHWALPAKCGEKVVPALDYESAVAKNMYRGFTTLVA